MDNVPRDKYVLYVDGDFLPWTNMFDRGEPTTDPMRATSVVAYGGPERWLSGPVLPGEIETREAVEARLKTKLQH